MLASQRIFPARLEWPAAVGNIDDVPRNTTRLRLISKAVKFEKLVEFEDLSELWCFGIDHKKLEYISRCKSLRHLYLDYNLRTGDLTPLRNLPLLEVLRLDSCSKINSLDQVAELTQLTGLAIENFKNLHDITPLSALINLKELAIDGSIWTRMKLESLKPIANLEKLELLSLTNTKVADESLEPLQRLANLKELILANFYPVAEFAKLSAKLPHCDCQWFKPFITTTLRCEKCGSNTRIMLSGKGTSMICGNCDAARLSRHVNEFQRVKDIASAGI